MTETTFSQANPAFAHVEPTEADWEQAAEAYGEESAQIAEETFEAQAEAVLAEEPEPEPEAEPEAEVEPEPEPEPEVEPEPEPDEE